MKRTFRAIALICCLTLAGCSVWATNVKSPVKLDGCQFWAPNVDLLASIAFASVAPSIAYSGVEMGEEDQMRMIIAGVFYAMGFFMSAVMGYTTYLDCKGYLPIDLSSDKTSN